MAANIDDLRGKVAQRHRIALIDGAIHTLDLARIAQGCRDRATGSRLDGQIAARVIRCQWVFQIWVMRHPLASA
jgi:hypothetical protein